MHGTSYGRSRSPRLTSKFIIHSTANNVAAERVGESLDVCRKPSEDVIQSEGARTKIVIEIFRLDGPIAAHGVFNAAASSPAHTDTGAGTRCADNGHCSGAAGGRAETVLGDFFVAVGEAAGAIEKQRGAGVKPRRPRAVPNRLSCWVVLVVNGAKPPTVGATVRFAAMLAPCKSASTPKTHWPSCLL